MAQKLDADVFQVEYKKSTQTDLLRNSLRDTLSILQSDRSESQDPEDLWNQAAAAQLRVLVLPLMLRFKHCAFKAEGERRLVYFLGSGGIENEYDKVKYRPGRGFVIPYLALPLAEGAGSLLPIRSVRCGPTIHPSLGKFGVASLLRRYSYNRVPVEESAVPYRI